MQISTLLEGQWAAGSGQWAVRKAKRLMQNILAFCIKRVPRCSGFKNLYSLLAYGLKLYLRAA
jgi:hypothetical protein